MNSLYRELAPIPDAAWEQIEAEANQALKRTLAATVCVASRCAMPPTNSPTATTSEQQS